MRELLVYMVCSISWSALAAANDGQEVASTEVKPTANPYATSFVQSFFQPQSVQPLTPQSYVLFNQQFPSTPVAVTEQNRQQPVYLPQPALQHNQQIFHPPQQAYQPNLVVKPQNQQLYQPNLVVKPQNIVQPQPQLFRPQNIAVAPIVHNNVVKHNILPTYYKLQNKNQQLKPQQQQIQKIYKPQEQRQNPRVHPLPQNRQKVFISPNQQPAGKYYYVNGKIVLLPNPVQGQVPHPLPYPGTQVQHPGLAYVNNHKPGAHQPFSKLYPATAPYENLPNPVAVQTRPPRVKVEREEEEEEEEESANVREEDVEEDDEDEQQLYERLARDRARQREESFRRAREREEEEEEEEEEVKPKKPFVPTLAAGKYIFNNDEADSAKQEEEEDEDSDRESSKAEVISERYPKSYYNPYVTPEGKYVFPKKYLAEEQDFYGPKESKTEILATKSEPNNKKHYMYQISKTFDDKPVEDRVPDQSQDSPVLHTKKVHNEKWYVTESTDDEDKR